jgi:uncharacterized protein (TIGR03435 family)
MVRALAYIGSAAILSGAMFAQSSEVAPKFGIVEIQASAPNTVPRMRSRFSGGRYELGNATMADLIRTAWGVDEDNLAGGPAWIDADRFDVIATAPAGSSPETLKTMLRVLLEERFHLLAHKDMRALPVYSVTVGRKPRLKPAVGSEEAGCRLPKSGNPILFECRNMTMAAFTGGLPRMPGASAYLFNYRVVDQTGLSGAWDFSVKWSMPNPSARGKAAGNTITLFDAFENQLGLKLKLIKIPSPVVVVDRIEKPALNLLESTEKPPARPLEFEVASIKPAAPDARGGNVAIRPGGRVSITMTLKDLIWEAWGNLNTDRIVGGPGFMDTTVWVIVAKAPTQEETPAGWSGPVWNGVDVNSMRMMLRALLIDRFKLATHMEDRLVSGYALVAGKPKLRKADSSNRPGCKDGAGADGAEANWKDPRLTNPLASRLVTCRNMTLAQFSAELSKPTGEQNPILFNFPPVVDSTGINGRFDMTINFTPPRVFDNIGGPAAEGDSVASEPDGAISIFEALEMQLGLRLESRKVTTQVLVIDHVDEMPTDN